MAKIQIKYTIEGETKTIDFLNDKRGNAASIKFLQELRANRQKDYCYYGLKKINDVKAKLEDRWSRNRKKLEEELKRLENDRTDYLALMCIDDAQPTITKIEITTI